MLQRLAVGFHLLQLGGQIALHVHPVLRLRPDGAGFVDGRGAQRLLFLQQLFGLLAILALIGLEQLVERGGVPLRALQFARGGAETFREGRVHVVRAEQAGIGSQLLRDLLLRALELLLDLRKLLLFRGDIRAQLARQIVESREQDDDNQETDDDR